MKQIYNICIELNAMRKETPKEFYGGIVTLVCLSIGLVTFMKIFH